MGLKIPISFSTDEERIVKMDKLVSKGKYRSRSHLIDDAIDSLFKELGDLK